MSYLNTERKILNNENWEIEDVVKAMQRVVYISLNPEHDIEGTLEKQIKNQHVTLAFNPTPEQIEMFKEFLGKEISMRVVGYGKDKDNEGLEVVILNEELPNFNNCVTHITLSTSLKGKPINTKNLKFGKDIPEEISVELDQEIKGKVVCFNGRGFSEELEKLDNVEFFKCWNEKNEPLVCCRRGDTYDILSFNKWGNLDLVERNLSEEEFDRRYDDGSMPCHSR